MTDNRTGIDTSAEAAKWVIERLEALKDADAALVVRALSAELTAARQALAWRPVASMPNSGKEVLMYDPYLGASVWPAKRPAWRGVTHWLPLPPSPTGHDDSGGYVKGNGA